MFPSGLTIYADEGHECRLRPANNNFWFYTWIQFIKRYLLN